MVCLVKDCVHHQGISKAGKNFDFCTLYLDLIQDSYGQKLFCSISPNCDSSLVHDFQGLGLYDVAFGYSFNNRPAPVVSLSLLSCDDKDIILFLNKGGV